MTQSRGSIAVRALVALTSLCLIAAECGIVYGHEKKKEYFVRTVVDPCMDQILTIGPTSVDTSVLPICPNQVITWNCPGAQLVFSVDFAVSPFQDGRLHFDDRDCMKSTGKTKPLTDPKGVQWDVYKYVLVVGTNYFDPHVIIVPGVLGGKAD